MGDLRLGENTDSEQTGWKGSLLRLKMDMLNCETEKMAWVQPSLRPYMSFLLTL